MKKFIRNIYYACFTLMLLLTSCFRDGLEECPPESEYYSYINFIYDYNMSFEDLFHRQVAKVDVYLFDGDGVFMQKLVDQVPKGSTFKRGYVLGLPEDYKDVVQFVTFAGHYDDQTRATEMVAGKSTIHDLELALSDITNTVDHSLEPLWHGNLAFKTRAVIARNDTTTIPLVKNTNTVRIILQSLDSKLTVDVDDFSFALIANNQNCNAFNETTGVDPWTYVPHYTNNDADAGAIAELHTMRMLSDRENRLTIKNKIDGSSLLDVNLNMYINALKLQKYKNMPLQEYMDREDEYNVVVFLTKEKPSGRWIAGKITINSWIVREQDGTDIE